MSIFSPEPDGRSDPMQLARAKPELPKRFYREAGYREEPEGYVLTLDGRPARTPARKPLAAPSPALADALAAEWQAQGERIDPATMPLTRILNSAIDGVTERAAEVRREVASYAGSDLICYRADAPEGLVARQNAAWEPLVAWAREVLGARLVLVEGVMPVAQDEASLAAVAEALEAASAAELAALHTITTLTSSAILALAVARGRLSVDEAWSAAHVDEDWQIAQWGEDAEASARRAARRREMDAAALILSAARGSAG